MSVIDLTPALKYIEYTVGDVIISESQVPFLGCLLLTAEGQVVQSSAIVQINNIIKKGGKVVKLRDHISDEIKKHVNDQFRPGINLDKAFEKFKFNNLKMIIR